MEAEGLVTLAIELRHISCVKAQAEPPQFENKQQSKTINGIAILHVCPLCGEKVLSNILTAEATE